MAKTAAERRKPAATTKAPRDTRRRGPAKADSRLERELNETLHDFDRRVAAVHARLDVILATKGGK